MVTKLTIFVRVQDNAIMYLDNFNTLNKENIIVLFLANVQMAQSPMVKKVDGV